ncbi:hypothetical protein PIROE2DRAFT_11694 [Piromyces sp. E2]|nr:hypothetical protein PIROE2DRAFT_11694 [Piromyces sp. E2]|eukprot:OUM62139.1 hypothetical protein PIROE2DRAFT_11694 [Piromyces sp. E2]
MIVSNINFVFNSDDNSIDSISTVHVNSNVTNYLFIEFCKCQTKVGTFSDTPFLVCADITVKQTSTASATNGDHSFGS